MSGIDTNIAAAALAISLVAFVTALGQLLQQYFATADGYRRCQRSVMGDWAKKTRLRWRWREFRFETLYTTPEIFIDRRLDDSTRAFLSFRLGFIAVVTLDGSNASRNLSLIPSSDWDSLNNSHERVCWLELLDSIQTSASALRINDINGYCPAVIRFQERSWDFQPPDVVRPLAKTSVGGIAIIARRLGMRWKEFDPVHGIMRAEGNDQVITATSIRSLGTVIQYIDSRDATTRDEPSERFIPVQTADLLGFGWVTTLDSSFSHDFVIDIGTRERTLATLRALEPSGHCATALQILYKEDPTTI
jgi:hypothetical protein